MAAPTFQAVGTPASTSGGAGATVPTWPAHVANDIGLLLVETTTPETVAAPAGWTQVTGSPQADSGGSSTQLAVFWKRAASSSETNPSIPDPGNHCHAVIVTFRGCITSGDPVDVTRSEERRVGDECR